jgi:glycosyltransferase involved in cell wall biosynthesis
LLRNCLEDKELNLRFIESSHNNIFRKSLHIRKDLIIENPLKKYPIFFQRYMNINNAEESGIFHSSYYRIINDPKYINITTVHDFTYEYYIQGYKKYIHHKQKSNAIIKSKKIICVSENTKCDLLKFYPFIHEDQISVVYNGVSEDYHVLDINNVIPISNLIPFDSKDYALYIGDRSCSYKNFKLAIEACSIVKSPIVIVGGGVLSTDEKKWISSVLGNDMFVQLNGLNNQKLNILYNNAFCLLYPSVYEGFGIPIIEAQRSGCPIISSSYSSIPEVAGNGAILIEDINSKKVADAMFQLRRNLSLRDSLIKYGLENSIRFSWQKAYKETKNIYKELFSKYF